MAGPTIYDVAKAAGVGVGTVSRVLNNSTRVSPETQEKVTNAIRELGYRPSKVARQLSTGVQHRNIGAIMPFIAQPSYVERLRGMQLALNDLGNTFNLILYNVSELARFGELLVEVVDQAAVDGLLIVTLDVSDEAREFLGQANVPFVTLSDFSGGLPNNISQDNILGGYLATRHLLELGHRRIAYVGDTFTKSHGFPARASELRYSGFLSALQEYEQPCYPEYVRLGEHGEETAYRLTQQLLTLPELPTAIFVMSDLQAVGCLEAIREANLRVPDDISVIGFDDVQFSRYVGLTTIRQHLEQSGYLGMRLLLEMLANPEGVVYRALPPLELVIRSTTKPCSGPD
ncbi:MAG: LacI family DNA-binding transcriptional regulator [Anaerolineae bacterium]